MYIEIKRMFVFVFDIYVFPVFMIYLHSQPFALQPFMQPWLKAALQFSDLSILREKRHYIEEPIARSDELYDSTSVMSQPAGVTTSNPEETTEIKHVLVGAIDINKLKRIESQMEDLKVGLGLRRAGLWPGNSCD